MKQQTIRNQETLFAWAAQAVEHPLPEPVRRRARRSLPTTSARWRRARSSRR
jgi:hypothetical protein